MALICMCTTYRFSNYISSMIRSSIAIVMIRTKSMAVDVDVLDDFTTQLMQKKIDKWEHLKVKQKIPCFTQTKSVGDYALGGRMKEISTNELNLAFEKHLDGDNQCSIIALIGECIRYSRCPSELILTNILSSLSQGANIEGIYKMQELCSAMNSEYLKVNSDFKHHLAEAIWLKGNINKSIDIFEQVFRENPFLRRRIRLVLRYLVSDAVANKGEAVLINIISFTERLVKEHKDYYVMACVWQTCFLSEWFSDHQIAFNLLEKNTNLCKEIVTQIPYAVSLSLRQHRTEPVYRLLEVLLQYELKWQSSIVLVALFDYRFKQGNLDSCCEILNWSSKCKIMLPSDQHEKFLRLLLKANDGEHKKRHIPPKFNLRF